MKKADLVREFLKQHNEKFADYRKNRKEPRYHTKTFFLYSYNLFDRLGERWNNYRKNYQSRRGVEAQRGRANKMVEGKKLLSRKK